MLTNYLIDKPIKIKHKKIKRITHKNRQEKRLKNLNVLGEGNPCPKCKEIMQRRGHKEKPIKNFFYVKWDYCIKCKHVQHYPEFMSPDWQEFERQQEFMKTI